MNIFRIELDNEFEADVLAAIMEEEKIPHTVISHSSSAYDGLFQMTMGWGHMDIPEEYQKKAEELVQGYKDSLPE